VIDAWRRSRLEIKRGREGERRVQWSAVSLLSVIATEKESKSSLETTKKKRNPETGRGYPVKVRYLNLA